MLALLFLILWPIAEVLVAIKVAQAIGVLVTVLLLVLGWPVGLWAMRAEGRAAWRRLQAAAAQGRRPGREVLDGALVLLGAILLTIPGFITDVVGLALLLAPTRALAGGALARNLQSRIVLAATRFAARPRSSYDVDSTAAELDHRRLRP